MACAPDRRMARRAQEIITSIRPGGAIAGERTGADMNTVKIAILSAALMVCAAGVFAASKVTAGVGHMCCGRCKAVATAGLAKVADGVSIEEDNITLTPKGDDLLPALEALRKSGFP